MPMPNDDYVKAVYCGEPHNWFEEESDWTVRAGDKGRVVKHHKRDGTVTILFYPNKWKGFCFSISRSDFKEIS